MSNTINVIDSIMGAGKTTFLIDMLRRTAADDMFQASFASPDPSHVRTKFLVIVPTLKEIERLNKELPEFGFKEPSEKEHDKVKRKGHGKKFYDLGCLIEDGENIISTHALFSQMDRELYTKLREANYTLVIDEVIETVALYNRLTPKDRAILFAQNMVSVDPDTWRLVWNDEKWADYTGRFDEIRRLCDTGALVVFRGQTLLWEFPAEFMACFKAVWLATYMFDASPFSAYLKAAGFSFNRLTVSGDKPPRLIPWEEAGNREAAEIKPKLRKLITVYEGSANDIGKEESRNHPMSSGWYDRQDRDKTGALARLKASTENFFRNIAKTNSNVNGWSTFTDHRKTLAGHAYSRNSDREGDSYGFMPWNCRATNDYAKVEAMAYLCNIYYHPDVRAYFEALGVNVSNDLFALSALVQWVFRGRIRKDQPITLFIPSERMRDLFKRWLASDSTPELVWEIAGGEIVFPLQSHRPRKAVLAEAA